jgi:hypothetical protein
VSELSQQDALDRVRVVLEAEFHELFVRRWNDYLEFWEDDTPGPYNIAAPLALIVVDASLPLFAGQSDKASDALCERLERVFDEIERVMTQSSREGRGVLVVGILEGVQNILLNQGKDPSVLERFLGPRTQRGWEWLNRIWAGRSTLAGVIRAEVEGAIEEPDW